ncbi:MAG: transcription antitermination factor NusB [Elusimicrobia bacterium]|nr:transcription antitermination factor NusB [Elusimicrobiota bacterium]
MGRRRQAREIALQALYIADAAGTPEAEAFASVNRGKSEADAKTKDFARELLKGTLSHRAKLDEAISAVAENWSLARMPLVDRNVLRLAAYELLNSGDTPIGVVIDEAIEIVRKYSTEDSTRFVNGVLDKLKDKRPG